MKADFKNTVITPETRPIIEESSDEEEVKSTFYVNPEIVNKLEI
jgi:hypothetical protein